jgi:hypothetical protein
LNLPSEAHRAAPEDGAAEAALPIYEPTSHAAVVSLSCWFSALLALSLASISTP